MLLSFLVPRITPVLMPNASKSERDHYGFLLSAMTFAGIWLGALIFGKVSLEVWHHVSHYFSYWFDPQKNCNFQYQCSALVFRRITSHPWQ